MAKRMALCYLTAVICLVLLLPVFKVGIVSAALTGGSGADYAQAEFVPDEIIVKFKKGLARQKIDTFLSNRKTTIKSINPQAGFMVLKVHDKGLSIRELVQRFRMNKQVEYAEPNYLLHACLSPNDPDYPQLWGLHNTGQNGGLPDADIDAPEAWDLQIGSSSLIIAVIDSGVDYNHEDLASNMWTNPGEIAGNGLDDDGNGFIDDVHGWDFVNNDHDPMDDYSHGTHCAGIIAAEGNNGLGVVGVNWTASIMPVKFLNAAGSGTTSDAILAIQYATQMGAKVMSNSWGGGGYSQALRDAIATATAAGALFVAAAGNDGQNNDLMPHYPSSYEVANIIAVAATDCNDQLASFSNYGSSSVDLGAPGVSILSTVPHNGYAYKSGTSMATPYVAGVAALLMAEYPSLTNEEIKAEILNSVDKIPALTGMTVSEGRLNAYNALAGIVQPPPTLVTVFDDDMEAGINGWTVSGDSLWHHSTHRFKSPVTSWYYGIEEAYNYDTGDRNSGSLTSPAIDLSGISSSKLVFTHFLETENYPPYDTAKVRISKDGGLTYTDIISKNTTNGSLMEETIDISAFDGCVIQIQFFFDTVDDWFNNYEGWYIDDVTVKGKPIGPPAPNQPPVAEAGSDKNAYVGDQVSFDASGSYDPDGSITSYDWDFGDGTPHGTGVATTHIYSTAGNYTVILTVTDNGGLTAADTCLATIPEKPSSAMHVGDIAMSLNDLKLKPVIFTSAVAGVLILDSSGMPIEGATVSGHWSGLTSDTDTGFSCADGKVSLRSNWIMNAKGTFTFTVDNVALAGWTYDPSANLETSDSITK